MRRSVSDVGICGEVTTELWGLKGEGGANVSLTVGFKFERIFVLVVELYDDTGDTCG